MRYLMILMGWSIVACGEVKIPEGPADASIDAWIADAEVNIDVNPALNWDLVYPRVIQISLRDSGVSGGMKHYAVINTGDVPLDISSMQASAGKDNSPDMTIVLNTVSAEVTLPPQSALGDLPETVLEEWVDEPLVQTQTLLEWQVEDPPIEGAVVESVFFVGIEGIPIYADQTWLVQNVPEGTVNVQEWARVSSRNP